MMPPCSTLFQLSCPTAAVASPGAIAENSDMLKEAKLIPTYAARQRTAYSENQTLMMDVTECRAILRSAIGSSLGVNLWLTCPDTADPPVNAETGHPAGRWVGE